MNNKTRLSNCCNASVSNDSFGALGYETVCCECGTMNPATHIKGEKYEKTTPLTTIRELGKVLTISFRCAMCKEVSNVPGAILFSPPKIHVCQEVVTKHHICGHCYHNILLKIEE